MQPKLYLVVIPGFLYSVTFWRCISFVPCISTLYFLCWGSVSDESIALFIFCELMNKMILIFMYPSYLLDGRVDRIRTQCIFSIAETAKLCSKWLCPCPVLSHSDLSVHCEPYGLQSPGSHVYEDFERISGVAVFYICVPCIGRQILHF